MALWRVSFAEQLSELLPSDLPHREIVVAKSARHLELIAEANQHFNLTRITDAREAAIKHVLDSVMPWRSFLHAPEVVDVGTGAGFPGVPLALVLPDVRFTLVESVGKKARFVESAIEQLALPNVNVMPRRVEETLRGRTNTVFTARALAPLPKAVDLFGPAIRVGCRAVLYKGPEAEAEITRAEPKLRKYGLRALISQTYTLPDEMGSRTIVEIRGARSK